VFQLGQILLMKSEEDELPVILDTEFPITAVAWSNSGTQFVVTGVVGTGSTRLRFFSSAGKSLRTINIEAQNISSIAYNYSDRQLVVGVDNYVLLVQIIPDNAWSYLEDTLVYGDTGRMKTGFFQFKNRRKTYQKYDRFDRNCGQFKKCIIGFVKW
jgi:WD repeat-containing protein 35